MKMMKASVWAIAAAACLVGGLAQAGADPSHPAVRRAVNDYLRDHGDLCVGKFTWPRFVTEADRQSGSNDAVQMPVLERLGLVESVELSVAVPQAGSAPDAASFPIGPVKRYSLTATGRQYYLQKKRTVLGVHDQTMVRDADLCVARLSLDKVVKWSAPEPAHGHLQTVVAYTYKIKPAQWMADPEARKVFPVVDRIISGAGRTQMTATLQRQNGRWAPVLPGQ
jgi:hypothetical protein